MSQSNSNVQIPKIAGRARDASTPAREPVFWRVEGSLLNLTAVRPVGFFAWNSQSFLQRWTRRGAMATLAIARPFLYVTDRVFATRLLHTVLRGVSRDRLDLLGEEFFEYFLKPRLKERGIVKLNEAVAAGGEIILVSQGLDHVMRPLAKHLGAARFISNRLDFREGIATGRLLEPVIRPRGAFARFTEGQPDGRLSREKLIKVLGFEKNPEVLDDAIQPAGRPKPNSYVPVVHFESRNGRAPLSVRETLRGKNILLIGATGFIGKVWLANLLTDLPDIGRIFLLVRHNRAATSLQRLQRVIEESPVFERLAERHGDRFAEYLRERVEVVDGDVSQPGLGLSVETKKRLARSLDVIVNSSGLTDFNPDLRDALATNVRATAYVLDFLRECEHASLLHLSTCYVVGQRDGRVLEELPANYTPHGIKNYDAVQEWQSLENLVRETEARAESAEVTEELQPRRAEKGTRRERPARCRAGKSNPQEPCPLAAPDAYRRRLTPRHRTRLAQHLHFHEEPLRVADPQFSGRESRGRNRRRASRDRRIVAGKAVSRLERGHQHFRAAFLSAGNVFPPAAHQRNASAWT